MHSLRPTFPVRRLSLLLAVLLSTLALSARAQFSVFHVFNNGADNAAHPVAALVQDPADGSFYGTTARGGSSNNGTVFRLAADGTTTVLYNFNGRRNGGEPVAALVLGTDGNLYGTTQYGGDYDEGIAFRLTTGGGFTKLFDFGGGYGEEPVASLLLGADGNFYGTTQYGGYYGEGTVFQMTAGGVVTILFDFGGDYGSQPVAALVDGRNGLLYGTTQNGGLYDNGTVFSVSTTGTLAVLHDFRGNSDGVFPQGALFLAASGSFYGTTANGGQDGYGTVFSITTGGTLTTLHEFNGTDGSHPEAAVVAGQDGNFYGTTFFGGASDHGTVFELTPAGAFTSVLSFEDSAGTLPAAPLISATDGNLYGTTSRGGVANNNQDDGVVFRLEVAPATTLVSAAVTGGTTINESGGTTVVTVTRGGTAGTASALTVNYALKGTAVNGVDYTALSGTVTIPAGATSAPVVISAIDRGIDAGGTVKLKLKLQAGDGYSVDAAGKKVVVLIVEDE